MSLPAARRRRSTVRPWRRRAAAGARAAAVRRRRLARLRRQLEAFEASNRYQAELKGTTLALIAYMDDYWCEPERAADFERWWRVVRRYATVLASDPFTGRGARQRLQRLLNENQERPSDL